MEQNHYSPEGQLKFHNRMSAERWKTTALNLSQEDKDYQLLLIDAKLKGYEQGRFEYVQRQIPPKRARPSIDYLVVELETLKN